MKLPNPIIITRFRICARPSFIYRSPELWTCYGSNDGLAFTVILKASNDANNLETGDYIDNVFEKTLTTCNTLYFYIGWTISKLVGNNSGATLLTFSELELFGKNRIQPFYVSPTVFYASLNNIINTKQDNVLFTSPLLKDISNNITFDLSAYPWKTYIDES